MPACTMAHFGVDQFETYHQRMKEISVRNTAGAASLKHHQAPYVVQAHLVSSCTLNFHALDRASGRAAARRHRAAATDDAADAAGATSREGEDAHQEQEHATPPHHVVVRCVRDVTFVPRAALNPARAPLWPNTILRSQGQFP